MVTPPLVANTHITTLAGKLLLFRASSFITAVRFWKCFIDFSSAKYVRFVL